MNWNKKLGFFISLNEAIESHWSECVLRLQTDRQIQTKTQNVCFEKPVSKPLKPL